MLSIGKSARRLLLAVATIVLLFGAVACQRWFLIEVTDPAQALIQVESWGIPTLEDDLDRDSLKAAIGQSLVYLSRLPADRTFQYGPRKVTVPQVRETLRAALQLLNGNDSDEVVWRRLQEDFLWFKAAGRDVFGGVLFTGYYLPLLEGRLQGGEAFRYPLYRMPQDLVETNLGSFRDSLKGQRLVGRLQGKKLVPYHTRAEIDGKGALKGKGLELVWLKDPIDRFFLHIQGSGQVRLEDGRSLNVNYAGANGHPYRSIGRVLIDEGSIPRDQMSMQAIRAYLQANPARMDEIFYANPSYVFFRIVDPGPLGSLEVPITTGRSIATDSRLFPKAGLAFIRTVKPEGLDAEGRPASWKAFSRLVVNQDTGGSIRGAGRVDIYCGAGPEAEIMAGYLQHEGKLYFLLKK